MKKKKIKLCWVCVTVFLFVLALRSLTELMNPGYAYTKNQEFLEDGEMYDILFLGNSHMTNAVYPMELWHTYGIASYNLAGYGNRIPTTYWMMEYALEHSDPKLVVLDCAHLSLDGKVKTKALLHAQIDCLPFDVQKWRMLCDLIEEPEERLEFIWDFAAYHDRWWDLDQGDFEKERNLEKGAKIEIDVVSPLGLADRPSQRIPFTSLGTDYLRRIIEECKRRDIEILLVYLPYSAIQEEWQEAFCAEQIAEEQGIPFINFLELSVVDLGVDSYDQHEHLNGSGGRKVTDYMGEYIARHYDIDDHRGEEAYLDWDEDYMRYTDYKLGRMGQLETLDKYLMMLADRAYSCCIYVDGEAGIWKQNEMYRPLINNIAGGRAERIEEAPGNDYFLMVDNAGGGVYESVDGEPLQVEASFGNVYYAGDGDEANKLLLQDGADDYLLETEQGNGVAVQLVVVNNLDGSIVDVKRFDSSLRVYTE